ncbi:EscU/YscU/HrcU family type III secretion system export apparatus switch protein [Erwinia mallotivora]|uniref:EscU/YscU/HrcU family type III secretion system export apparatus switch protein n=1 Tax=Erwinia mallotivora TaxID=69222 RepID=UPI0035E5069D
MSLKGESSEKTTVSKLKKNHEQGEILRAREAGLAAGPIAGLLVLTTLFPWYRNVIHSSLLAMRQLAGHLNEKGTLHQFMRLNILIVLKITLSLLPVPVAARLPDLIAACWIFVARHIPPGCRKLSPLAGIGCREHRFQVLKMVFKCSVLLVVVGLTLQQRLPLLDQKDSFPGGTLTVALTQFAEIMQRFIIVIALFALSDVSFRPFLFLRQMRVSKRD